MIRTPSLLGRDVRIAARRLRRQPTFTIPVVATFAIGLGAVASIFTLVNGVMLRPLPYPYSKRLVAIGHLPTAANLSAGGASEADVILYQAKSRSFERVAGFYRRDLSLTGGTVPERVAGALVTPDFFRVLGVAPLLGRDCSASSFKDWNLMTSSRVVVISHALWMRRFGGDPGVVGRTIDEVNRFRMTIAGVMPGDFGFPSRQTALWFCWPIDTLNPGLGARNLTAIARLRPNADLQMARADLSRLDALSNARAGRSPADEHDEPRATARPLRELVIGDVRRTLTLLACAAILLWTVALANVANLFLTRTEREQHLTAVERAIGASDWDLARRAIIEGVLVASIGGCIALGVAAAVVTWHFGFDTSSIPRLDEVRPDAVLIALTAGLALTSGFALGIVSFARSRRVAVMRSLAHAKAASKVTASRQWRRSAHALIAVQLAFALALVIGSLAMLKSYVHLAEANVGFDPTNTLIIDLSLPGLDYRRYADVARFYSEVAARARRLPGVRSAEVAGGSLPLAPLHPGEYWTVSPSTSPHRGDGALQVPVAAVTPRWFAALGVRLLSGRTFQSGDLAGPVPVIVSRSLAGSLFGGADPLGRRIRIGGSRYAEQIIGVVADLPGMSVADGPMRTVYFPILDDLRATPDVEPQTPLIPAEMSLFVRGDADTPTSLLPALGRIVRELDPHVPISRPRMLADVVAGSIARARLTMLLLLVAASATLALGIIGIYGVTSYIVGARIRELTMRLALGATSTDVRWMVVRQHTVATAAGLVIGLGVAIAITRVLRGLLYQVATVDPWIFTGASAAVVLVAMTASWLPSRRIAHLDLVSALRTE